MEDSNINVPPENLAKRKTNSSTNTHDLKTTNIQINVLESINKKLEVLCLLLQEIKDLKVSLEFTHQQIDNLQRDNAELHSTLASVSLEVDLLKKENNFLKEPVLDIQNRSIWDNLIFTGIPKNAPDKPEALVRNCMVYTLKIPTDSVNNSGFTGFTGSDPEEETVPVLSSLTLNSSSRKCL